MFDSLRDLLGRVESGVGHAVAGINPFAAQPAFAPASPKSAPISKFNPAARPDTTNLNPAPKPVTPIPYIPQMDLPDYTVQTPGQTPGFRPLDTPILRPTTGFVPQANLIPASPAALQAQSFSRPRYSI